MNIQYSKELKNMTKQQVIEKWSNLSVEYNKLNVQLTAQEEENRIKAQRIHDLELENRCIKGENKNLAEAKVKVLEKGFSDCLGTLHYVLGNSFCEALLQQGIIIKKEDEF